MNTVEPEIVVEKPPEQPAPQEEASVPVVVEDSTFTPLKENRKAIADNQSYYSVERFQHKDSKYRWTGRTYKEPEDQTIMRFSREQLLLALYKLVGINVATKQLSRQRESNIPIVAPGQ